MVWDHAPVSGSDLLLMLAIADQANDQGTDAWPSIEKLARRTRMSERTVQRRIRCLEAQGLLKVDTGGGRRSNRYAIDLASLTQGLHDADHRRPPPPTRRHPRHPVTADRPDTPAVTPDRHPTPVTATSPDPSYNDLDPPPPARTDASHNPEPAQVHATTLAVLDRLRQAWPLSPRDEEQLRPMISTAVSAGTQPDSLAAHLTERTHGARSPLAVIASRLNRINERPAKSSPNTNWPPWCGKCDGPLPQERWIQVSAHQVLRCPNCNPMIESRQKP
ncbi:helix-turn-helix domain-containing protein [Lentzea sp. NPDC059081]|uniref:helix-turn-helix domain-containing protein n=1 Tax=Lentzea sp. NPDC059081 TaxID=3346719 RepID=UPI0036A73165